MPAQGRRRASNLPLQSRLVPQPPTEIRAFTLAFAERMDTLSTKVGISEPYRPEWGTQEPEIRERMAIWDTGATKSVISTKVAEAMQLVPTGQTRQKTANGERDAFLYTVNIFLPNDVVFAVMEVIDGIMDADVLIGMDIIGAGDFAVTHKYGHTVMSYQVPSDTNINFVHELRGCVQNNLEVAFPSVSATHRWGTDGIMDKCGSFPARSSTIKHR